MGEIVKTTSLFRTIAARRGMAFFVPAQGGGLFLLGEEPGKVDCIDWAPVTSERAVELVRRAVREFGLYYLSDQESS